MKFSLIVPTRERPTLLIKLCQSIQEKTNHLNNIEMLIACDDDDASTKEILPDLLHKYTWLQCHYRQQGNSLSRDYQNWLYTKCQGQYVFILNDDVEFMTKNWDTIALSCIQQYPDDIFYGWVADDANNIRIHKDQNSYSCFPIISRKSIDILGYVMHEYYGGWSADIFLHNIYKKIDRVLNLSMILVQHYSPWLGNRQQDNTNKIMQNKSVNTNMIDFDSEANKLLQFIKPIATLL